MKLLDKDKYKETKFLQMPFDRVPLEVVEKGYNLLKIKLEH